LTASSEKYAASSWFPFKIAPSFADRVWGTSDLRPWFDVAAKEKRIGEAWLTGDQCTVATGAFSGQRLDALFAAHGEALLGPAALQQLRSGLSGANSPSPLLIKVIFAREKLSVQVHPDDEMAHKYGEPRGKTECWYVLESTPGALVACGLKPGVTLDDLKAGIADGTLENSLKMLELSAGELIYVDAGTVHAIWPGAILLETQQNCDLTYRMYDYGRGRELHIEKSLEAIKFSTRAGIVNPVKRADRTILINGAYFRIERINTAASLSSASLRDRAAEPEPGLAYLFAAAGSARIAAPGFEALEFAKGGLVAVPARSPEFAIEDRGGLELIRITPRWPGAT
jgi:mannose-6-phosphate isomerase